MAPASGPSSCAPCASLAPRLQRDAKHAGHLLQPPGNEAVTRALASTRGGQRQRRLTTETGGRTSRAGPQGATCHQIVPPSGPSCEARSAVRGVVQTHSRCTASRGPGGLSMRITDELCEAGSTFRYCVFLYSDNRS